MSVHICALIYEHTYVCVHIWTNIWRYVPNMFGTIHKCSYMNTHIRVNIYEHSVFEDSDHYDSTPRNFVHICAPIYGNTYMRTHMFIYVLPYVVAHICVHIYVCTYMSFWLSIYERIWTENSVYKFRISTPHVLSTVLPKGRSKIYCHTTLTAPQNWVQDSKITHRYIYVYTYMSNHIWTTIYEYPYMVAHIWTIYDHMWTREPWIWRADCDAVNVWGRNPEYDGKNLYGPLDNSYMDKMYTYMGYHIW